MEAVRETRAPWWWKLVAPHREVARLRAEIAALSADGSA